MRDSLEKELEEEVCEISSGCGESSIMGLQDSCSLSELAGEARLVDVARGNTIKQEAMEV